MTRTTKPEPPRPPNPTDAHTDEARTLGRGHASGRATQITASEALRRRIARDEVALRDQLGHFWSAVGDGLEAHGAAYNAESGAPPLRVQRTAGSGELERFEVLTGRADRAGLVMTLQAELARVRIVRQPPAGGEGRLLSMEELDAFVAAGAIASGSPSNPLTPAGLAWHALEPLLRALGAQPAAGAE